LGQPALTITANANFLVSGRFTRSERDQGITIRDPARLQSRQTRRAYSEVADAINKHHSNTMNIVSEFVVGERYTNDQIRYTLSLENLGGSRPSVTKGGRLEHLAVMTTFETAREQKLKTPTLIGLKATSCSTPPQANKAIRR